MAASASWLGALRAACGRLSPGFPALRLYPLARLPPLDQDRKTLRRLLSTRSVVTTVLPLKDGRVLRIRKPSLPDPEQVLIYQNLGIRWKTTFPPVKSFANP